MHNRVNGFMESNGAFERYVIHHWLGAKSLLRCANATHLKRMFSWHVFILLKWYRLVLCNGYVTVREQRFAKLILPNSAIGVEYYVFAKFALDCPETMLDAPDPREQTPLLNDGNGTTPPLEGRALHRVEGDGQGEHWTVFWSCISPNLTQNRTARRRIW